jgi:hypothetical protein
MKQQNAGKQRDFIKCATGVALGAQLELSCRQLQGAATNALMKQEIWLVFVDKIRNQNVG